MKIYFIKCYTEMVGTDSYELIEANTEREAEQQANELAMENFQSYDFEQIESDCEDGGMVFIESEYYDYELEEYNPEKHDGYLHKSDIERFAPHAVGEKDED